MQIIVMGAGRMARGFIFDILQNETINTITVIDRSPEALKLLSDFFNSPRINTVCLEANDIDTLRPYFKNADGAISAIPYDYNLALSELAIESGTHLVDLGGNNDVVKKQFYLNDKARAHNVAIFPDSGLAPGLVSILAAYAIDQLARTDRVEIRVGGLPTHPQTPLKYMQVFSIHGLINEYIEPALILRDGYLEKVPSMSGLEEITFPDPFNKLEAFYTSGGTSTLPYTFEKDVPNLDYKTIRYRGHARLIQTMIDLGFTDDANRIQVAGQEISARAAFEAMLKKPLTYDSDDVVLIRVTAAGRKAGLDKTIIYQAVEYGSDGLSAMMRMTAFPAAIILQMILNGKINRRGVLKQETDVPGWDFLWEMKKRDIVFE